MGGVFLAMSGRGLIFLPVIFLPAVFLPIVRGHETRLSLCDFHWRGLIEVAVAWFGDVLEDACRYTVVESRENSGELQFLE